MAKATARQGPEEKGRPQPKCDLTNVITQSPGLLVPRKVLLQVENWKELWHILKPDQTCQQNLRAPECR